ncbi:sigma-54 dependent transcriptional regulator [Halothiobacillus diazotrophicus]|nr:sigma-54 dependent transcriptional regulator [Halothiobacillus diazotrophicus]
MSAIQQANTHPEYTSHAAKLDSLATFFNRRGDDHDPFPEESNRRRNNGLMDDAIARTGKRASQGKTLERRQLIYLSFRKDDIGEDVARIASSFMWDVTLVHDCDQLQRALKHAPVKVVLADLRDAVSKLGACLVQTTHKYPNVQWVGLVEPQAADSPTYAAFLHSYFFDFCFLPLEPLRLFFSLGHAWTMARVADIHADTVSVDAGTAGINEQGLIGSSPIMKTVRAHLKRYARNDLPVLITGPTGTGKEMAARYLHEHSDRHDRPFIAVNCGALTPSLVQSELFGHEKGAFTGAHQRKIGRVEAADGGTLMLDEIGDLPLETQVSLLRFLQEGVIERVGSDRSIPVNVRIVAATHVDLEQSVAEGRFREDLYFRLNVLRLVMPPLAERGTDVVELAQHFIHRFADELGLEHKVLCPAALAALSAYTWPGNVRELMNRLKRAIVHSDRQAIGPADLEFTTLVSEPLPSLAQARNEAELQALSRALVTTNSNVTEAAEMLGISRVSMHRLINKHGLSAP